MKKTHFTRIRVAMVAAAFALPLVLGVTACSSSGDDDDNNEPALSYTYVTRNRGFICGSVIYNPDGTNNQLESGTKIGIRLGYMNASYETVTQLDNVDFDTTDVEVTLDENNNQTIAGGVTTSTVLKKISEDIPSRARYGFLSINAVSTDSISFTATLFSADGSSYSTVSKTIQSGGGCDLNGDNQNDLTYDVPPIKRTGYENARWLTFVCDEDAGYTTMYFTFTEKEKAAGYRAALDQYAVSVPAEGFYGVNSNGRFIYLRTVSNATNASSLSNFTDGAAFGDFIIGMDDKATLLKSELDEVEIEFGTGEEAELASTTSTETKATVAANCYTVTGSTASNASDFGDYTYTYDYEASQFPDKVNGPKDLLDKLVANDMVKAAVVILHGSEMLPETADKVIALLNKIIADQSTIETIATANGVTEEDTTGYTFDKKYGRRFIDLYYTQSPTADIDAPDISNVYPFMFANIGNVLEGDYTAARTVYYDYSGMERAISSSYDDFSSKRDTINKKWNEFAQIKITKATYEENGQKKTIVFATDLGLTMGAGVKGGVSVSTSKAQVDLGAVIYVSLDASGEQAANNFVKYLTSGLKIGIPDAQMYIGPVPIVYGVAVTIGFNLESNINPHLCFIGLYGGETSFGARYGIEWKRKWFIWYPSPYFNTFGSANKICETEAYIGMGKSSDTPYIIWGPWVKVSPSVGLGWSVVSVRASAPITASFKMKNELPTFKIVDANLGLKVQIVPYFEADVKIFSIRKDFGTFNVVDGTLELYPNIRWK